MKRNVFPVIVLILALIAPLIIQNDYYRHLMILVLMWVAIGAGWNLISGYTGQDLFGAAVFFGPRFPGIRPARPRCLKAASAL